MTWTMIAAMGIPSAVTAFCFWLIERRIAQRDEEARIERDRRQQEADLREHKRRLYELCQLNMTAASMALAEATAEAVQRIPDAHCNGDMHSALEYAKKVKNEQKDFLREQAINNLEV